MSLPPHIRIFFAVDLPKEIKTEINKYVSSLKKASNHAPIRWCRPENLHITLQFIADLHSGDLAALIDGARLLLQESLSSEQVFLTKVQFFPNPFRPRVIVLDIEPQETLMRISTGLGQILRTLGYKTEERPFHAHLTLARIKQPKSLNLSFIQAVPLPAFQPISVESVVLFRSEPEEHGSCYTSLKQFNLGHNLKQSVGKL